MAVADKVSTVLTWSLHFRYQMLDRMRQDCEYFLGCGNRVTKYLWAGNVADHIEYMKALWWSFPESGKPEWLTLEEIKDYERRMAA